MKILFPLLATAALAACASGGDSASTAANTASRTCFMPDEVGGWKDAGAGKFNLRTTKGEYYTSILFGSCPDADFSQSLAVVPQFSRRVCEGEEATIIVPSRALGRTQRCKIDDIRKLSAEEVVALRPVEKP